MKRILLLIASLLSLTIYAQGNKTDVENVPFTYEQSSYLETILPYRKAVISSETAGKPILVIYLHGGSARGNDNERQMVEIGIESISNHLIEKQINAVLLIPQCPKEKEWGKQMNPVLKSLIDEYIAAGSIDTERIYILGGSMGGRGTWSMLSDYPDLFAAAMPVAGKPFLCNAENVAKTPVITVLGGSDRLASPDEVTGFIKKVKAAGGEIKSTIKSGWKHGDTCKRSYTSSRLDWLFSHKR